MEMVTKSAKETFNFGKKVGIYLTSLPVGREAIILCLTGELGSGKTTFIQGLAKGLGILRIVPSPSFTIVRHYNLKLKNFSSFYHVDLFRLEKRGEIGGLGLTEIFSDPSSICAVEWAEKMTVLPKKRIDIKFTIIDEDTRNIKIRVV